MPQHKWGRKDDLPRNPCKTCGKIIEPRQHIDKLGRSKGWYVPLAYCSNSCSTIAKNRTGARGRFIDKAGYVLLTNRAADRAFTNAKNYQQPEHRAVMEQMLGRKLLKHETVHHKNGIRTDNRPENLELWSGRHGRGQRVADLPVEDIWSGNTPQYLIDCKI